MPVEGGEYVEKAKIGSAIADADIIISLTHFKGHMSTGFGGTLKNIGMGSGSKRGKMEMHCSSMPHISERLCIGCGMCVKNCANDGVHVVDGKAVIDEETCLGCGYCIAYCPRNAINPKWDGANQTIVKKIAEYTKAVIDGKPAFHISMVMNVSPDCDCERHNDVPIIPDVGMFASFDPVAIDQACADMANAQPIVPGSKADVDCCHEHGSAKKDVFTMVHPDTDWECGLEHAVKLGLGTREYELVEI